jgi:hypothetical protein
MALTAFLAKPCFMLLTVGDGLPVWVVFALHFLFLSPQSYLRIPFPVKGPRSFLPYYWEHEMVHIFETIFHRPLVPRRRDSFEAPRTLRKGVFFWRIGERPILQKPRAFGHR